MHTLKLADDTAESPEYAFRGSFEPFPPWRASTKPHLIWNMVSRLGHAVFYTLTH